MGWGVKGGLRGAGLAAAVLAALAGGPATAQEALIVECREGAIMLENWYDPASAIGREGDKVLPLHMMLRGAGSYTFEFQGELPFAVYAYRYDPARRDWTFLPESATAQGAPGGELPWSWTVTVRKPSAQAEDYLLQVAPQGEAQFERHRFLHIRRIAGCR